MNSSVLSIQSATQMKNAGKNLHLTDAYIADPHKAIMDFVSPFLDKINIAPAKLLVATYRQKERTAGGLIKTQNYMEEDKFQGITGLVLKLGPACFTDEARIKFYDFKASAEQWVIYKPEDGRATEIHGLHCRIIEDLNIDAVVVDPELLW